MGGAQSAQRGDSGRPGAEEEPEEAGAPGESCSAHTQTLKNNGQICETSGKADGTLAEVNGHSEDEIAAEAIFSTDKDVLDAPQEETPLKESPNETDTNEERMIEMDVMQNDINEGFRRFFTNINVKLTVKRGSAENADSTEVPDETTSQEPNRPEDDEDAAKESKDETVKHNTDLSAPQETCDHSIRPTLTDVSAEDVLENADEKTTNEGVDSDSTGPAATTSPVSEEDKVEQNATPEEEVVVSPIKRFFTTGIFSGLRKKKKPAEEETTEKELVDMRKTESVEKTEQTVEVEQQDKEISLCVEAGETDHKENGLKEEILSVASAQTADEGKSHSVDKSTFTVKEPEILTSQEKDKVPASPLKRLLSGSSFKKSSKTQRDRKPSDAKLSDSGEHVSNQLLSSTEADESQKEGSPAGEDDGAWATFKKLVTPKKLMKRSSLTNEETHIPGQESKPSEGEQISDHSTEEGKKRKDSSVSWEAVLCGSGRRRSRSRKTSDSEDEKPQGEDDNNKKESPLESPNEVDENTDSYSKRAGGPSDCDGGSTWKSLKKLVTPKKKAKDEDENKDNMLSDGEVTQDDTSFSIKKLLPGRKKRKPTEKQDHVSSDEADKEETSADEDSETPAVVPLSEFDTAETGVHLQTHADIESHEPNKADDELQQDKISEPVLPCDILQTGEKKVQNSEDALENKASTAPAAIEEPDDLKELISKHQQLSDIPEEATPASGTEEPVRDDTIAEDFIEITSEAITAPEPVDITLADESEMISAVSQLSESSKTSGNTTPVTAEYDIKDTEVLLQQVVENISTSPKAVPVSSDEINSERIVASASCQILETSLNQNTTILQIHRRSDATAIHTGLNAKELDAINQLVATAQTESISEVNEALSIEIVSEVASEEFDTAEIAADEIHKVHVTHLEESIQEIESTNDLDLEECQSELDEAMSTEIQLETEEHVADECSLVKAEVEASQTDIQKEETKDGAVEHEVQTVLEITDEIMQNITDQDQPPAVVQGLQALTSVEPDIRAAESGTDEPEEETELLTEDNLKSQKEKELQTDAVKTEQGQVPEVLRAEQTAALVSDIGSNKTPEKKLPSSEDSLPAGTREVKDETEPVTEVTEDDQQAHAAKTEYEQVVDVLDVHADTSDSQMGSIQTPELSGNAPPAEAVTEPTKETKQAPKINVESERKDKPQADTEKLEHVQVSDVLEGVQATALKFEMGSDKTIEKEVPSPEEILSAETVEQELKEQTEPVTDVHIELENEDKLQVDVPEVLAVQAEMGSVQTPENQAPSSEDTAPQEKVTDGLKDETEPLTKVHVEPEKEDELKADDAKTEYEEAPEEEMGSIQTENEVPLLEDIPPAETVTGETKEESKLVAKVHVEPGKKDELQTDAAKIEQIQVSKILGSIQSESEMAGIQTSEKEAPSSEDNPPDEPKHLTEVSVEAGNKKAPEGAPIMEHLEVTVVLEVPTLDVEEGSANPFKEDTESEVASVAETLTDKLEEEREHLDEVNVGPHVQEPEVVEAVQIAKLGSEEDSGVSEETLLAETAQEPAEANEGSTELGEELQVEDVKDEKQEYPCDVKDTITETESGQEASEITKVEKQVLLEYVPDPDDYVIVSVIEKKESEVISELKAETKSILQEPEGTICEVELQSLSAVHMSSVIEGKKVTSEETPSAQCLDNAMLSYEPKYEVQLGELQGRVEGEKEGQLPGAEMKTVAAEYAVLAQVMTCNLKEVSTAIPDVVIEKTSDIKEPLIETVVSEMEFREEVERATPIKTDDQTKTAKEGSEVVMMHVPSAKFEDNHKIQVHLVEADLKSAEMTVEEAQLITCSLKEVSTGSYEPNYEVQLGELQGRVEGEKEGQLPGAEMKTVAAEYAVLAQVMTCNLKEVSTAIPDVVIEKTSDIKEPLIETVVSEMEFREEVERATPIKTDDQTKTAKEGSEVVMMHVPSAKFEDNHKIQVQLVEADLKSAEMIVEEAQLITCSLKEVSTVSYEPTHELQVGELQGNSEREKEGQLPGAEMKTVAAEHAVLAQVMTCNLKEVSTAIPEVLIEKTSDIKEPLIETVVSEMEFSEEVERATPIKTDDQTNDQEEDLKEQKAELDKSEPDVTAGEIKLPAIEHVEEEQVMTCNLKEVSTAIPEVLIEKTSDINEPLIEIVVSEMEFREEVERATPIKTDDQTKTTKEGSEVVMMHVPSPKFEDNHKIQVQLVEADLKSAEMTVEEAQLITCSLKEVSKVSYEPTHELQVGELQGNSEREKEGRIPAPEMKTVAAEHAVLAQVMTCNLKEVSTAIPDVLIEKTSDIKEPLIETVVSEMEFSEEVERATPIKTDDQTNDQEEDLKEQKAELDKSEPDVTAGEIKLPAIEHVEEEQVMTCNLKEVSTAIPEVLIEKTSDINEPLIEIVVSEMEFREEVERATPIKTDDQTKTTKEGSEVVMMHVPSPKFEDNHKTQVQLVEVDLKSAEMTVDSVLDVGVTQAQDVIEVCQETDKLSASEDTEEEPINKENKVIIQEVIQHLQENLPERAAVQPSIQDERIKEPDGVREVYKIVEEKSNEDETQGTLSRSRGETPVIADDSAAQQVSEGPVQTTNIPESVDVSMHDQEEDPEEQNAELDKSEPEITSEEIKLPATEHVEEAQVITCSLKEVSKVSYEPKYEVQLGELQGSSEREKEGQIPAPEMKIVAAEHAVLAQVITCKREEVSSAIPDVLIEKTSDINEPLIETVVSEMEFSEEVERATPIKTDDQTNDQEEDLKEQKAELDKSEPDVTAGEIKLHSEDIKITNEGGQFLQTSRRPTVTASNTGLEVPQNTGIISSIGLESASSLSLEFKLNIQFGQTKAPASPPAATETPLTEVLEVGVQAAEPSVNATIRGETQKKTVLTAAVQATEITESEPAERAVVTNQPVLLDIGIQAMEEVQTTEQIKPTETNIQVTETTQPVRSTENQAVLYKACHEEKKVEESVKQIEEIEQDLWMDAQEDVYAQEPKVSIVKVEKPLEHQTDGIQEERTMFEMAPETAPVSKTEEERESPQEIHQTGETENEEFAVALEHPETSTATMEWD